MSKYITVVHVNAGREFVDAEAILAFRDRCFNRPFVEEEAKDPFYIPPFLDRRDK